MTNADIRFRTIRDEKGGEVKSPRPARTLLEHRPPSPKDAHARLLRGLRSTSMNAQRSRRGRATVFSPRETLVLTISTGQRAPILENLIAVIGANLEPIGGTPVGAR
jgi:hypothetical protein